jgi:hypothetical protein
MFFDEMASWQNDMALFSFKKSIFLKNEKRWHANDENTIRPIHFSADQVTNELG